MASMLERLINKRVTRVARFERQTSLMFGNDACLAIFNPYEFTGAVINSLTGEVVIGAFESDAVAQLQFSDSYSLTISLAANDYLGPEAMELILGDADITVWN